jgi:hypothetical protein
MGASENSILHDHHGGAMSWSDSIVRAIEKSETRKSVTLNYDSLLEASASVWLSSVDRAVVSVPGGLISPMRGHMSPTDWAGGDETRKLNAAVPIVRLERQKSADLFDGVIFLGPDDRVEHAPDVGAARLLAFLAALLGIVASLSLLSWLSDWGPMVILNPFVAMLLLVLCPFVALMGVAARRDA